MTMFSIVAYLDPGTGSLIMQAILGGLAGIAVFFRAGRRRLFGRSKMGPTAEQEASPATDE